MNQQLGMWLYTELLGELKEFPNIRNYQEVIVNLVSCDDCGLVENMSLLLEIHIEAFTAKYHDVYGIYFKIFQQQNRRNNMTK